MKNSIIILLLFLSVSVQCSEMTASQKIDLVNSLTQGIKDHYVLIENIEKIEAGLEHLIKQPEFSVASDAQKVADVLSGELKNYDKHFAVQWVERTQTTIKSHRNESWFNKLGRKNSGFNKVEVLDGNIGYVEFWGFDALNERSLSTVKHVMGVISDVDALIIDLRNNGGGSAEMVQLISSYFLEKRTHLNSFYTRETDSISEFWTFDNVKSKIAPNLPIYLLTSAKTFSAAEEFAYNFKHLKRATIVGETTKGGANPWRYVELGNGFRAAIPNAKAINPITKTNWEGVGVKPHVNIASEKAFNRAYLMALEALKAKAKNKYQQLEIEAKLVELKRNKARNSDS